jgi:hypothetical protein
MTIILKLPNYAKNNIMMKFTKLESLTKNQGQSIEHFCKSIGREVLAVNQPSKIKKNVSFRLPITSDVEVNTQTTACFETTEIVSFKSIS